MKKHAITSDTPKKIPLGAGIFVKNFKWDASGNKWTFDELGATRGGGKVNYTREFLDPELDGKTVKTEDMEIKLGEIAQMEMNLAEYKKDTIVSMFGLKQDTNDASTGYVKFSSKPNVENGDYIDNVAFIGFTADGKEFIVLFDHAICLSAFEFEGKNKEQSVLKVVVDCVAGIDQEDLTYLPVHFYFPNEASA